MTTHRWGAVAAVGAALLVVASMPLGLNGDVQYVLGGLSVHDAQDPLRFVDTFTHRPIAYRGILSVMSDVVSLAGLEPTRMRLYEAGIRILAVAIATGVGVALWLGLRGRLGRPEAAAVAVAAALSLALAPNFDFLQPEWFAAVFLALGVAAGIGVAHELGAGIAAGVLLTLAVAVKLATAPLAITGVILIWLIDRRRGRVASMAGPLAGAAWLLIILVTPHEWGWMRDMAALNPNSALRNALGFTDAMNALEAIGTKLAVSPVLVLVPAALVMIGRTLSGRARRAVPLALLLALAFAAAPMLIQAQWLLYHVAHLPALGGGIVAFAGVRWWRHAARPPWLLLTAFPVIAAWTTLALSLSAVWRASNAWGVISGLVLVSLLLAAAPMFLGDMREPRRRPHAEPATTVGRPWASGLAVASVLLAALTTLSPAAAWSLNPRLATYTNAGWSNLALTARDGLGAVRDRIPPGDQVLYLAYGTVAYHVRRPTACRYPSPLFIQRTVWFDYVQEFPSYADNLACITTGDEAWALLQPDWMRLNRIDLTARALIYATFQCGARIHGDVQICRRR